VGQFTPEKQIHDYNPGIAPSGLFWTIPIPDESVKIDLGKATASMAFSNLHTRDFHDFVNTAHRGPSVPADVSFRIRWSGVTDRVQIRDEKNQFVGNFIEDTATVSWSSKQKDFQFVSDPASTSTSLFAEIGRERNGVFFS
jgi:hypothetical protein